MAEHMIGGTLTDLERPTDAAQRQDSRISDMAADVKDAISSTARKEGDELASQAGDVSLETRDNVVAGLSTFSHALEKAGEDLKGDNLSLAADLVSQAASGLGGLARSLEGKSPVEMLGAVRTFGRQNPVGFVAISVLAGFALGRVASAAPVAGDRPSAGQAMPKSEGTNP